MPFDKYKFSKLVPWFGKDNDDGKRGIKTINIFIGFFFLLNFCVGTGFLGVPYSFFYAGYLAGLPTLLLVGFVSWLNAIWLLEVMARAQALAYYHRLQHPESDSDTTDSEVDDESTKSLMVKVKHPKFEITIKRKFETVEMCEIFFNRWIKYLYLVIIVIYTFFACWSFATVAGTAWAVNIPLNFGSVHQCEDTAFHNHLLPTGGCLYAYYFSLFLFGVVVITLSLLDLKEQSLVQVFLGVLRFVTVAAIVLYSIVKLVGGGDVCERQLSLFNVSNFTLSDYKPLSKADIVFKFDSKGWLTLIPVFTYAFHLHSGIPSVTHPIKQKKYLHWLFVAMFLSTGLCYFSLGVIVPLWFKASVQEIVTLNFASFTGPGNPVLMRIFSYSIILFPSIDVMSAYSLNVVVMVNNLYLLITGRDTSRKPKHKYDYILRFSLRFVASFLPLLAAFGVANLIYVLKYAGLFAFFICFIFTTALELRSEYVCMHTFGNVLISDSNVTSSVKMVQQTAKEKTSSVFSNKDKWLTSIKDFLSKDKQVLYLTPYSNAVLSHPIVVGAVGLVGVTLLLLSIASLFVHVDKMSCFMPSMSVTEIANYIDMHM